MSSPDKSAALARLLSRNTKSAKRRDDLRSAKGRERRKSFQFMSPDGLTLSRLRDGLQWSSDVEGDALDYLRPWSAAAFVHALHPVASFTPSKYGKLSDLDMHIAGAIERRDTHRDLLAETMERMAKHNDRLRLEAQRLRVESQERAAKTIQIYWRLYREQLIERRKAERRKKSTWMESVRRRRPESEADEEEEEEEAEVEDKDAEKGGTGKKKDKNASGKKKGKKKGSKPPGSHRASGGSGREGSAGEGGEQRKKSRKRKGKRKGSVRGDTGEGANASASGELQAQQELEQRLRELVEQEEQWQRIRSRVMLSGSGVAEGEAGVVVMPRLGALEEMEEGFEDEDEGDEEEDEEGEYGEEEDEEAEEAGIEGEDEASSSFSGDGCEEEDDGGDQDADAADAVTGDGQAADGNVGREQDSSAGMGQGEDFGGWGEEAEAAEDGRGEEEGEAIAGTRSTTGDGGRSGNGTQSGAAGNEEEEVMTGDDGSPKVHTVLPQRLLSLHGLLPSGGGDNATGSPWNSGRDDMDMSAHAAAAVAAAGGGPTTGRSIVLGSPSDEGSPLFRMPSLSARSRLSTRAKETYTAAAASARAKRASPAGLGLPGALGFAGADAASHALTPLQNDARNIPSKLRVHDPSKGSSSVSGSGANLIPIGGSGVEYVPQETSPRRPFRTLMMRERKYLDGPLWRDPPVRRVKSYESLTQLGSAGPRAATGDGDPTTPATAPAWAIGASGSGGGEGEGEGEGVQLTMYSPRMSPAVTASGNISSSGASPAAVVAGTASRGTATAASRSGTAAAAAAGGAPSVSFSGTQVVFAGDLDAMFGAHRSVSGVIAAAGAAAAASSGSGYAVGPEASSSSVRRFLSTDSGSERTFLTATTMPITATPANAAPASVALASMAVADAATDAAAAAATAAAAAAGAEAGESHSDPSSPVLLRRSNTSRRQAPVYVLELPEAVSIPLQTLYSLSRTSSPVLGADGRLHVTPLHWPGQLEPAVTVAPAATAIPGTASSRRSVRSPGAGDRSTPGGVSTGGEADAVARRAAAVGRTGSWGETQLTAGLTPEASCSSVRSAGGVGYVLPQIERSAPALLQGTGSIASAVSTPNLPWRYRADALREVFSQAQLEPAQLLQRVMTPPRGVRGRPLATPQQAAARQPQAQQVQAQPQQPDATDLFPRTNLSQHLATLLSSHPRTVSPHKAHHNHHYLTLNRHQRSRSPAGGPDTVPQLPAPAAAASPAPSAATIPTSHQGNPQSTMASAPLQQPQGPMQGLEFGAFAETPPTSALAGRPPVTPTIYMGASWALPPPAPLQQLPSEVPSGAGDAVPLTSPLHSTPGSSSSPSIRSSTLLNGTAAPPPPPFPELAHPEASSTSFSHQQPPLAAEASDQGVVVEIARKLASQAGYATTVRAPERRAAQTAGVDIDQGPATPTLQSAQGSTVEVEASEVAPQEAWDGGGGAADTSTVAGDGGFTPEEQVPALGSAMAAAPATATPISMRAIGSPPPPAATPASLPALMGAAAAPWVAAHDGGLAAAAAYSRAWPISASGETSAGGTATRGAAPVAIACTTGRRSFGETSAPSLPVASTSPGNGHVWASPGSSPAAKRYYGGAGGGSGGGALRDRSSSPGPGPGPSSSASIRSQPQSQSHMHYPSPYLKSQHQTQQHSQQRRLLRTQSSYEHALNAAGVEEGAAAGPGGGGKGADAGADTEAASKNMSYGYGLRQSNQLSGEPSSSGPGAAAPAYGRISSRLTPLATSGRIAPPADVDVSPMDDDDDDGAHPSASAPTSPSAGAGPASAGTYVFWASAQASTTYRTPRTGVPVGSPPSHQPNHHNAAGSSPQRQAMRGVRQQRQEQPYVGVQDPKSHAAALARGRGYVVSPHHVMSQERAGLYGDLLGHATWQQQQLQPRAGPGVQADAVGAAADALSVHSPSKAQPQQQPPQQLPLLTPAVSITTSAYNGDAGGVVLRGEWLEAEQVRAGAKGRLRREASVPWQQQQQQQLQQSLSRGGARGNTAEGTEAFWALDGLGSDHSSNLPLPVVTPPPMLTTRLVVRRPAPVLRLPVVAASQAAQQQQFSPTKLNMSNSGIAGTYADGADRYLVATASYDGVAQDRDLYGSATAPAAAASTGRSYTPEPYFMTMSISSSFTPLYDSTRSQPPLMQDLRSPPAQQLQQKQQRAVSSPTPPPLLSPEASRASLGAESSSAALGGAAAGNAGGSKAALREWRSLERWWQAKGLDGAAVQFHKQSANHKRTVYL